MNLVSPRYICIEMSPMRNRSMTKETLTHTSNCSISSYTTWAISALKLSGALPFARAAGYFFWPSCAPSRRKNKKHQQKHITSLASCCAPVWKNKSFATFPTFAPKNKNLDTFFAMGHFEPPFQSRFRSPRCSPNFPQVFPYGPFQNPSSSPGIADSKMWIQN